MKLIIEIATENAAFGESITDAVGETSRILQRLITSLGKYGVLEQDGRPLYDSNGNSVGLFRVVQEPTTAPNLQAALEYFLEKFTDGRTEVRRDILEEWAEEARRALAKVKA